MTDLRIVTKDGERVEVSNTYLSMSDEDKNQVLNALGLPGTFFNRSQSPSKREVKAASGKQGRKQHNWRHQQHLNSPTPPAPPKNKTARSAGLPGQTKSAHDANVEHFDTHPANNKTPWDRW